MSDASKVLKELGVSQLGFIEEELSYSKDDIASMSDDEVAKLYDRIADIEVEEVCKAEGTKNVSERGNMAADIVTVIGNELYAIEEDD